MIYRIRYRQKGAALDGEVTIEANTPNEALVKFQCTRQDPRSGLPAHAMVTSVCAAAPEDALAW